METKVRGVETLSPQEKTVIEKMPSTISAIVMEFYKKMPNLSLGAIINFVLFHTTHATLSKKIKYSKAGELVVPNYFARVFAKSGAGKDYITKDIERFILPDFKNWFLQQAEQEYKIQVALYNAQKKQEEENEKESAEEILAERRLPDDKRTIQAF